MQENIAEYFTSLRNMIRDIPDRFKYNKEEIKELEDEQNDLLHMAEFANFNAFQGYKIASQIQQVRRRRRELKNENELIEPMLPMLKKLKGDLHNMDNIIGEVRKRSDVQKVRIYNCRVRKDLQDSINKIKVINL